MTTKPDDIRELATAFAEFVRRARRAPLTRRERERLVAYVKENAHLIAPGLEREIPETVDRRSAAWQDLGYR